MALAAEAAWCAQDQGNFFAYQHALYENQGLMSLNQETLSGLGASIGLDSAALARCLASRTHRADVEKARRAAIEAGVTATPTFFVNARRVEGNQPYQAFRQIIERELAAAP